MDYEQLKKICGDLGYTHLTPLQEQTFRSAEFWEPGRNQMIIGPTSAGKTLVPLALYYAMVLETARVGDEVPKLLFVVPYRALAAQKCHELSDGFNQVYGVEHTLTAAQSTSEYRDEDQRIAHGLLDISVVINEKVFLFASADRRFLQQFDMIVFDEIGLLKDEARGLKLDFLLSWIYGMQQAVVPGERCPRMFCLGTPFYDWSAYAQSFGFALQQADGRPQLRELPVYVKRTEKGVHVDMPHWPKETDGPWTYQRIREGDVRPWIRCPHLSKTENQLCDPEQNHCRDVGSRRPCPYSEELCQRQVGWIPKGVNRRFPVIADLCRWHLRRSRQILIFWNDRENVRALSAYLYRELQGALPQPPKTIEECRRKVLQACTETEGTLGGESLDFTQDDLYGLFDDDNYRGFCAGVAFHSSALPAEMRAAVERRFLGEAPTLKIVCSTETLAYGINSAVDVVIVADMAKTLGGSRVFLKANEYQNYVGRAGRLKKGMSTEEIVGYVHPVLSAAGPDELDYDPDAKECRLFRELKADSDTPETVTSMIYKKDNGYSPFMLLCLVPEKAQDAIRLSRLRRLVESLPAPEGQEGIQLDKMLAQLEKCRLICRVDRSHHMGLDTEPRYYTTEQGACVKGYTPSIQDYKRILAAMQGAMRGGRIDEPLLLYLLMETDSMKKRIENLHLRSRIDPKGEGSEEDREDEESRKRVAARFAPGDILDTLDRYGCAGPMRYILEPFAGGRVQNIATREKILVTAAVLSWAKTANPHILFDRFRIPYPLLQGLTRDLCYLLEIAAAAAFSVKEECLQDEEELRARLSVLERSIRYGLDTEHYDRLLAYFRQQPSDEAARIADRMSRLEPTVARQIRSIVRDSIVVEQAVADGGADGHPYGERNPEAVLQALRRINRRGGLWKRFAGTTIRTAERGTV